MSDDPYPDSEKKQSVVTVKLEDKDSAEPQVDYETQHKAEQFDSLMENLKADFNEKYGTEMFSKLNDMNSVKELAELLDSQRETRRETSTGIIELRKHADKDYFQREYADAGDMISDLYRVMREADSPEKVTQAKEYSDKLAKLLTKDLEEFNKQVGMNFLTSAQQLKHYEKSMMPYGKSARHQYFTDRYGNFVPIEMSEIYAKGKLKPIR